MGIFCRRKVWQRQGLSVVDALDGNILYINVMNRLGIDCDGNPSEPGMHDIGILASTDNNASFVQRMEGRNAFNILVYY